MTKEQLRWLISDECFRLAKLGPGGIARELASRGMQGFRANDKACPLARSLCDTLMIGGGIRVYSLGVVDDPSPNTATYNYVNFKEGLLPLRQFVENFDAGLYPHLEQGVVI